MTRWKELRNTILEGWTNDEMRIFDWLFNGSSPKSITHTPLRGPRKCGSHRLFRFPKSSFGRHKLVTKDHSIPENQHLRIVGMILQTLCSPNEDFERPNQHIARHRACLFCKPILAISLQRKHQTIIMLVSLLCFVYCKPILPMLLHQTIITHVRGLQIFALTV